MRTVVSALLFCLSFVLISTAQQTTDWQKILDRAQVTGPTPAGFDAKNVQLNPGDAATLGIGSDAKEYLKSKYDRATMQNGCVKSKDKAINGLDTKFAECAAKFFKQWEQKNGPVRITSAFRDYNDQICVCKGTRGLCAAPGKSKHQKGIAIDVHPANGNYAAFHAAAKAFGGLHFPLGMRDQPHLEPNGAVCASGDGGQLDQTNIFQQQPFSPFQQPAQGPGSFMPTPNQQAVNNVNQANRQAEAQAASGVPQGGGGSNGGAGAGAADGSGFPGAKSASPFGQGVSSLVLPQPSATLTCSPDMLERGATTELAWECPAGAVPRVTTPRRVRVALGTSASTGAVDIAPSTNTEYLLACVRDTVLVANASCAVAVRDAVKTAELTISLSESSVMQNETVVVAWLAKNVVAGSCSLIGPNDFEYTGSKGRAETDPLTAAADFVLTCTTLTGDSIEKRAHVDVSRTRRVQQAVPNTQEEQLRNPLNDLYD